MNEATSSGGLKITFERHADLCKPLSYGEALPPAFCLMCSCEYESAAIALVRAMDEVIGTICPLCLTPSERAQLRDVVRRQ